MNYAIEHQVTRYAYLVTTPRKKALKHSLIRVTEGLMLLRLGKNEYAVETGDSVWIPFDCLCALSFFPATKIERVDFSVRNTDPLPSQAGYVKQTEFSNALMNKLVHAKVKPDVEAEILQLLKREVAAFSPLLYTSELSEAISSWEPDSDSFLSRSHQLVLTMREAKKRMQSGAKPEQIVEDLFNNNQEEFEQLYQLVTGENYQ
ncbi:AraC family transcriptional regulator [Vibrio proteolyticus]